ncbi:hypothetical protein SLEP1_g14316 [Rubroshorea leprosula]|uniref:Uncharacterized protein n=1 Tax=Rubroshorea leprosula TaxID=152421 RepID=A0AAV5IIL5_9ROSI|nr:hypothetical protein SLEP1_g14316 [Rubroshorea leprosula]
MTPSRLRNPNVGWNLHHLGDTFPENHYLLGFLGSDLLPEGEDGEVSRAGEVGTLRIDVHRIQCGGLAMESLEFLDDVIILGGFHVQGARTRFVALHIRWEAVGWELHRRKEQWTRRARVGKQNARFVSNECK